MSAGHAPVTTRPAPTPLGMEPSIGFGDRLGLGERAVAGLDQAQGFAEQLGPVVVGGLQDRVAQEPGLIGDRQAGDLLERAA